jgi:arsenite methyltransferase
MKNSLFIICLALPIIIVLILVIFYAPTWCCKKKIGTSTDSRKTSCCSCRNGGCCPSTKTPENDAHKATKEIIKKAYGNVAEKGGFVCSTGGCCGGGAQLSQDIGYTREEIDSLADANLGLGCGNSVNLGEIKKGETILDLGSGAGLDCFLASRKVGPQGKVIGVDMTKAMIDKARKNAEKYKFTNVEFRLGDIEDLPIDNASVDIVMSNCVINLAPNKEKVFQEAFRVLKQGGKMAISDVVLTGPLTEEQKNDPKLLSACVSGAILKDDYLSLLKKAGFTVTIIDEDKEISKKWFGEKKLPISSLKFVAHKK